MWLEHLVFCVVSHCIYFGHFPFVTLSVLMNYGFLIHFRHLTIVGINVIVNFLSIFKSHDGYIQQRQCHVSIFS